MVSEERQVTRPLREQLVQEPQEHRMVELVLGEEIAWLVMLGKEDSIGCGLVVAVVVRAIVLQDTPVLPMPKVPQPLLVVWFTVVVYPTAPVRKGASPLG